MKELPILFNGPMVRAILEVRKTQTRRTIKPQPLWIAEPCVPFKTPDADPNGIIYCPYGQPGDRLWVRETIYAWGRWETRFSKKKGRDEWHFIDMTLESGKQYRYPATMTGDNGPRQRGSVTPQWWKRPPIHAPRCSSRILLEITSVRVERLQDIGEDDCLAEGIAQVVRERLPNIQQCGEYDAIDVDPVAEYRALWETINGAGSWDANPWVWVIEFKRVQP